MILEALLVKLNSTQNHFRELTPGVKSVTFGEIKSFSGSGPVLFEDRTNHGPSYFQPWFNDEHSL